MPARNCAYAISLAGVQVVAMVHGGAQVAGNQLHRLQRAGVGDGQAVVDT